MPLFLFLIALLLRIGRLNYSFWNDEAHVAVLARSIVEGPASEHFFGYFPTGLYQTAMYYLTAWQYRWFGPSEIALRLPLVIIGALIPAVTYIWAKHLFGKRSALLSGLLLATLTVEVAHSRQLRPYIALQLALVLGLILYAQITRNPKTRLMSFAQLLLVGFLGILFHTSFVPVFFWLAGFTALSIGREPWTALSPVKRIAFLVVTTLAGIICWQYLTVGQYAWSFISNFHLATFSARLFHYLKFYFYLLPLVLGTIITLIDLLFRRKFHLALLFSVLLFTIHMVGLLIPARSIYIRHIISAMPLIVVLGSVYLARDLPRVVSKRVYQVLLTLVALYLLLGGQWFFRPRAFASINVPLRETPQPDYRRFFTRVNALKRRHPQVKVLDSWMDRDMWYLSDRTLDGLLVAREEVTHKTDPFAQAANRITRDSFSHALYINNVAELENYLVRHRQVLVVIEEWPSLAGEAMQAFVRAHLRLENKTCDQDLGQENWCLSLYSQGLE